MKRALLALLVTSACSVDLQIPEDANITCNSDDDCPGQSVCDARKQCRSLEQAARGLPGFDISPSTVTVGESGSTAVVNVRLNAQPASAVTVILAADDGSEAFLSKNILTFTPENYGIAQSVTVTGERDCLADGPVTSHIIISPAQSEDPDYGGLDAPDVEVVTNDDIPSAGIIVTPTTGLETNESGNVTQFSVVVACKPTANVSFSIASSDDTEGSIGESELVFTPDNWAVPRVINVAGKGDCATDGDVEYAVELGTVASDDPLYAGIVPPNVRLINRDVVSGRVNISPNTGLRTSETLGQATFSVTLTCAPTANVTVPIATDDPTEGSTAVSSLTFTPANWNLPQAIIVTGVNDDYDDGNILYAVATGAMVSDDDGFDGLDPIDVSLTNDDDDTAGVTVSPQAVLHTAEPNVGSFFTIRLAAAPLSPVTISVMSSNTAEGTVSVSSVQLTDKNPLNIGVNSVDDSVDDDDQPYTIILGNIVSADPAFNGMDVPDVSMINDDNDTAGFISQGNNTENPYMYLMETGATNNTADGYVYLTSKPTADVVVQPMAQEANKFDVTVGTSLTFTPNNWQIPQFFTLRGKNDPSNNGHALSALRSNTTSADPKYNGASISVFVNTFEPTKVKYTYITSATYAANTVSPITGADPKCASGAPLGGTWRAAIVDGTNRSLSTSWVFQPGFVYVWSSFRGMLGVANASGTFDNGGWSQGSNYAGNNYWTGMDDNYAVAGNCANWTSVSASVTGEAGVSGQTGYTTTFSQYAQACNAPQSLFCIQQ